MRNQLNEKPGAMTAVKREGRCGSKKLQQRCNGFVLLIDAGRLMGDPEVSIEAGGSSLRDFFGADGNPGYFQQSYFVYGRTGEDCRVCGSPIKAIKQGQRSTFYCPECQLR